MFAPLLSPETGEKSVRTPKREESEEGRGEVPGGLLSLGHQSLIVDATSRALFMLRVGPDVGVLRSFATGEALS